MFWLRNKKVILFLVTHSFKSQLHIHDSGYDFCPDVTYTVK